MDSIVRGRGAHTFATVNQTADVGVEVALRQLVAVVATPGIQQPAVPWAAFAVVVGKRVDKGDKAGKQEDEAHGC